MPEYRRAFQPGGTFFFTVVTGGRQPFLCTSLARKFLHRALDTEIASRPFELTAIVLLPDHLHAIWTLPTRDDDFSSRWGRIKKRFTHEWLAAGMRESGISEKRKARHDRGVWQPRFWEHTILNEADFIAHVDYIHYNPVKHGQAKCPHAWPYSSFHRYVKEGRYDMDWRCSCKTNAKPPDFSGIVGFAME